MNTNQILSNLRKQKKKIDGERERLHHAIVAFEKLAGKAIEAGKKKYRMSRTAQKRVPAEPEEALGKIQSGKDGESLTLYNAAGRSQNQSQNPAIGPKIAQITPKMTELNPLKPARTKEPNRL